MLQYANGSRRAITGASLAQLRRRMSAAERACLAADIVDGRIALQGLTVKSIASLVGVNLGYVDRALRLTPEQRAEVRRGARPLPPAQKHTNDRPINWNAVDEEMLVEAIRRIGIDRALNAVIVADEASA